jgi:transketolase
MKLSERDLISRTNLARKQVLEDCYTYKNGHLSSCLSCVDIIGVLYFGGFIGEGKSKLVLSKGHANLTHNVVLLMMGYEVQEPTSHPEYGQIGVEATTGSLGQGLGIAVGMALANKINGSKEHVYCLIGDGECNEGLTLEGLNYTFYNDIPLTILMDNNGWGAEKKTSVSRNTEQVVYVNGHNVIELYKTFKNKPKIVCCDTIKGFGIPSIYNSPMIHYAIPTDENIKQFRGELYAHTAG